ncbi:Btg3 associated nuclear protein [Pristimantis euphronides]
MMSGQELAEVVQIAVEDLHPDHHPVVLENNEVTEDDMAPSLKRQRIEINCQDPSIKSFLFSINQTICLRLDSIESKLQVLEATCKSLEEKLDLIMNKQPTPIQVPMVAGSPLGATQTWNKVRCVVPQTTVILNNERQNSVVAKLESQEESMNRATESLENMLNSASARRHNTIVVKVPGPDDSHNDDDSGSEGSDTLSNCGQSGNSNMGSNVTLITLNSEEDFPSGTWLGDENNPEMRVRCPITAADMLHISTNCRTAEKMALTLLDYLFHREVQAVSNLSGQGKHGKKQLDPLMIYGIRCNTLGKWSLVFTPHQELLKKKHKLSNYPRTAGRNTKSAKRAGGNSLRKLRSKKVALLCLFLVTDSVQNTVSSSSDLQQAPPQALHYALANAQQVQIHQIGEDGQVQVGHLHIAQVPQGEQVQITQDSEGNLQIHQVHVGQDGQVLQGAQLIAVASADPTSGVVDGSPLQGNDIQVQYVQLAPVNETSATAQAVEPLQSALQPEMHIEHEAIQIQ